MSEAIVHVHAPAELTAATAPGFRSSFDSFFEASSQALVIDLSSVLVLTSGGLGALVHVGRRLSEHGTRVALAGGRRSIVRLIRLTGIDQVLPHFATAAQASAWLGPARTASD